MKIIFKYALVWICFIIGLNIFLLLGSLIPRSFVKKNIDESASILDLQGIGKKIGWCIIDNFTDTIMINQEYSIDNKDPIYSYMSARRNYNPEITKRTLTDQEYSRGLFDDYSLSQTEILKALVNNDKKIEISIIYARYWHGWMPILRILLIFMNISEIRWFNLIIFIVLMIYFLYLMTKRFGLTIALIFAYGLIVEDYLFVPFSISGVPCYLIIMISSIILLLKLDKMKNFGIYLFLIGCFTSSMDFLTVPLMTLIIPLLIYILHDKQSESKLTFLNIIGFCVAWSVGYGLTWISKWVIYDLIYKQGIIENALSVAKYRASRQLDITFLKENIEKSLAFISLGIILLISKMIIKKEKISLKNFLKENIYILFVAILPLIWYFTVMEHSIEHIFFTYKLISGFIIGMLLFVNNLIIKDGKDVELCQSQKK